MVVIYRIYRITVSAHYLAHHLAHYLVYYLVHRLVHHLAMASFLLMTQPTTTMAPAAVIALIRA